MRNAGRLGPVWATVLIWLRLTLAAVTLLNVSVGLADGIAVEALALPPLQVEGRPVRAHTQGLEVIADQFYVTARQETPLPKRALLLRTALDATTWDVWDVTPAAALSSAATIDHPGGMQSDGKRLWIPVAESKPKSRSVIRAFALASLGPGRPPKVDVEFPVNDHIGAVAVSTNQQLIYGASWDTETVYVWNLKGRLERTLNAPELRRLRLGATGPKDQPGLAVQDWKVVGNRLFASGLVRDAGSAGVAGSQLIVFDRFPDAVAPVGMISLSAQQETQLGREAMAMAGDWVYFLPEDLALTNRLFRIRSKALLDAPPAKSVPSR